MVLDYHSHELHKQASSSKKWREICTLLLNIGAFVASKKQLIHAIAPPKPRLGCFFKGLAL